MTEKPYDGGPTWPANLSSEIDQHWDVFTEFHVVRQIAQDLYYSIVDSVR